MKNFGIFTMPTYKEQQILDKVCKVTPQKQIKILWFYSFFRFSIWKNHFQLSALPLFTLLRGPCIREISDSNLETGRNSSNRESPGLSSRIDITAVCSSSMSIAVTWFTRALNSPWKLKSCGISWDLLQVDLISFLASGESILGHKAAKRATKSQDVFVPRRTQIGRRPFLTLKWRISLKSPWIFHRSPWIFLKAPWVKITFIKKMFCTNEWLKAQQYTNFLGNHASVFLLFRCSRHSSFSVICSILGTVR